MTTQTKLYVDQIPELVERVLKLYNKSKIDKNQRVIIALAGIPGSGKTTLSTEIVRILNRHIKAVAVPQDGFHLYRSELKQLADPQEAVLRRGAPFTFNSEKFLELVSHLNDERHNHETLRAPSFDHKIKDPIENDITIDPNTRIIILEGNYLLLKDRYWSDISSYIDESWFIEIPFAVAKERIIKRHMAAGICENEEDATDRVDKNDLVNAEYIIQNSKPSDVIIIAA